MKSLCTTELSLDVLFIKLSSYETQGKELQSHHTPELNGKIGSLTSGSSTLTKCGDCVYVCLLV